MNEVTTADEFEDRRVFPSILDKDKTCYSYEDVANLLVYTRKLESQLKDDGWISFKDKQPDVAAFQVFLEISLQGSRIHTAVGQPEINRIALIGGFSEWKPLNPLFWRYLPPEPSA